VVAATAGKDAATGAFGTTEGQVDVLGVLGRKVVEVTEDLGLVMFDEPAHEFGLDGLALGDGEGGAAGAPPGGDAVVADAVGAGVVDGLEEVGGVGGEVELAAVAAGTGSELGERFLDVGELLLEVGGGCVGDGGFIWHGKLYGAGEGE